MVEIYHTNPLKYTDGMTNSVDPDQTASAGQSDLGLHYLPRPLSAQKLIRRFTVFYITEPPHDKTNKMACAPSEDSDQPGLQLPTECTAKTLIRLGGCPG